MSYVLTRFEELSFDEKFIIEGGSNDERGAGSRAISIGIGVTLVVGGFFAVLATPFVGPKAAIGGFSAIGKGLYMVGGAI